MGTEEARVVAVVLAGFTSTAGYVAVMAAAVGVVLKSSQIADAFVRMQRSVRLTPGELGRRLRAPQQARWYWWLVRLLLIAWAVAVFVVAGLFLVGVMHTD